MSAPLSALRPVRGTHDLVGTDYTLFETIIQAAEIWSKRYGFQGIATPILEFTSVFQRPLGETSDIVSKEMFTLAPKGEGEQELVILRPEATAAVMRAIINNTLTHDLPLKFFYHGPMFRYDRPQKGRLREFHQFGCEAVGFQSPEIDVEVISLALNIFRNLGIQGLTLEINSLGDPTSRRAWRDALVAHFTPFKADLSPESQHRLEHNPLRILDSKSPVDQEIAKTLPPMDEFLTPESKGFFARVLGGLEGLNIPYTLAPRLVRGLDYYTHTIFEITTTALGAQATVCGGGRYDGLLRLMGGPDAPGVGWAMGIERLMMLMQTAMEPPRPIYIIALGDMAAPVALTLATQARSQSKRPVEALYGLSLKNALKKANLKNAEIAVIIGESECAQGAAVVKNMVDGTQTTLAFDAIPLYIWDLSL